MADKLIAYQFFVAQISHEPSADVVVMATPNGDHDGFFTPAFFDSLVGKWVQVVNTPRLRPANLGFAAKLLAWAVEKPNRTVRFTLDAAPPRAWSGGPPHKSLVGVEAFWIYLDGNPLKLRGEEQQLIS